MCNPCSFVTSGSIESIYIGGPVRALDSQNYLFTNTGENILVLDLSTGKKIAELEGDTETVTSFCVKPNGKHLVAASRSLHIRVWCLESFSVVATFKGHEAPVIVSDVDSTSSLAATGSADSTIRVWDINGGFYCTHNFKGHSGVISAVRFHPNPKKLWLASGSDDAKVRVWSLSDRNCVYVLDSHVSVIRGLDFSRDGSKMISGSRDKVVNVWNLSNGKVENTFPVYETLETTGVITDGIEFKGSKVENVFYTGGEKGQIRLWDMNTGSLLAEQRLISNTVHAYTDILYLKQSRTLLAVTNDQNIIGYSIPTLKQVRQLVGHNDQVIDTVFLSPHFEYVALATNSEQIRVFNTQTSDSETLYGHSAIVICLDWFAIDDSRGILVTAGKDRVAKLWSVDLSCTCIGHTESIEAVRISKKAGEFLLTGSQDHTVKYWSLDNIDYDGAPDSYEPRALYTKIAHEKDINAIDISPNDKLFATCSQDKTVKVWSVETGEIVGKCIGHKKGVWSVRFSPIDQVLATCSGDKSVKLWSVTDFTCLKTFEGHTNSVLKVDFITAGMQLVSAGSDGLVKVWTIKTEECVANLDKHTEKIWSLAVANDGELLVSGGADSVVTFWKDVTKEEKEKEFENQKQIIEQEQDLSNFLVAKDYKSAVLLALSLGQPRRLLSIFDDLLYHREQDDDTWKQTVSGSAVIDEMIPKLVPEQLVQLLEYVRDWNTNAKHSMVAQSVLRVVLESYSSEQLANMPGIKPILDALIPYSERHFQRMDQQLIDSFLVDYLLHAMDIGGVADS